MRWVTSNRSSVTSEVATFHLAQIAAMSQGLGNDAGVAGIGLGLTAGSDT
ncbi:MAG: hypothetical protein IPM08_01230 [Actinomycetales bacterium]|nr:hypothetical protein [Actinomycetales bacterium]